MREYETVFVLRGRTSEKEVEDLREKLGKIAEAHQGKVMSQESLGKKTLPYPMMKEKEGLYIHIDYTGNNKVVGEIEKILRYDDRIVRFMTTVTDKN